MKKFYVIAGCNCRGDNSIDFKGFIEAEDHDEAFRKYLLQECSVKSEEEAQEILDCREVFTYIEQEVKAYDDMEDWALIGENKKEVLLVAADENYI